MTKSHKIMLFIPFLVVVLSLISCAAVNLKDRTYVSQLDQSHPFHFGVDVGNGPGDTHPSSIKAKVHINGIWHEMDGPASGYGRWLYHAEPECTEKTQYSFRAHYTPRGGITKSGPATLGGLEEISTPGFGKFDWYHRGRFESQSGPAMIASVQYYIGETVSSFDIRIRLRQLMPNQSIRLTNVVLLTDPLNPNQAQWEVLTETPQSEYTPIQSVLPIDLSCPDVFLLKVKYTKTAVGTEVLVDGEYYAEIIVSAEDNNQNSMNFAIPITVHLFQTSS